VLFYFYLINHLRVYRTTLAYSYILSYIAKLFKQWNLLKFNLMLYSSDYIENISHTYIGIDRLYLVLVDFTSLCLNTSLLSYVLDSI